MRSLRRRLLWGTAIGSTVVLCAAAIVLFMLVRRSLVAEFDAVLATKALALAALTEQDGNQVKFEWDNLTMPEFARANRPDYFEVWSEDGDVIARSRSLQGGDLVRFGGPMDAPDFRPMPLPDGRPGRLAGVTFVPRREDEYEGEHQGGNAEGRQGLPQAHAVTLVVGRDTAALDATLARLKLILAGVWAAAILVMLGMLALAVQRGLRPLDRLAAQISAVDAESLSTEVRVADAPAEMAPVIRRLNDLFARLRAAFDREKSFTGDVAHELRTPLAGLRSTLEVALANPRKPDEYRESMADCRTITRQMQAMVDTLLLLARAEAGQMIVRRSPVDVRELLTECWSDVADRARARQLETEWRTADACILETDRGMLVQVVRTIFDNAVTHANEGGRVRIEALAENGRTTLRVTNTGSRLSQEEAQHVFERFWRGDAARARTGEHCGLGLSLCYRMVTLLGGNTIVESAAGGEFSTALEFTNA